ncbi:predicted protein [Thalassiosira pseudonana CCMP1335]|jgi:rubredoxin|uniref:Rubredoxin-like domain-containing protein n=1 Tax=Thalassiosira pseudonana TaxID=35128 RepID=B8BU96_THAPS|nr:predicted protein [Thalassiosira pseudonana CCMP1335]EED95245.1 predicted protein [Thalassiosira pseudonana CCMP1335]|mmetsp:Transcript_9275/g.20636  ORF Transcript_9275/g.20636 Transcript_9275/m.20636 type:complete len:150 (+) Transcript_9275:77-526(+)|eukprot:g10421.t1 g10421   contig4:1848358-1848807(+)
MFKNLLIALIAAICMAQTLAFAPSTPRAIVTQQRSTIATPTSLNVFGKKKTQAQKEEEEALAAKYWQGEWVCKDCGYIYNRAECAGMYFEEQGAGFRCPQCSGPRRRYAKKVGDRVGTTLDGGDAPILLFSFGGLIATIVFGVWAVQNL